MKRFFTVLLLLSIYRNASASAIDLHLMMHASNADQMSRSLTRSREIPRLRSLCVAQLKKKYVPDACFEALALQTPARAPEPWLVDNCVRAATSLNDLRVLRRLAAIAVLPSACHGELQKRAGDLKYAAETESPATLFEAGSDGNVR